MRVLQAVLLALVFLLAACSSPGSGPTPTFNYSGQWSGTINDSIGGNGIISVAMTQSGKSLAGTWQATFADGSNGGSLAGTVNNESVIIELYPSVSSACPYNVIANRSGTTLIGNYAAFNCTIAVTGTLTVTKQ